MWQRTPGVSLRRRSAASRRPLSRAIISRGPAWSPVSASSAPYWAKWLGHDSMFTFMRVMMSMIGFGPTAAPRRQPVIAYFLLNVYRMTVRSCMPGRETIDSLAPWKRTSKYASSLSTSRSCLSAISAMRSSSSGGALGGRGVVQVVEDEQARARRDAPLDRVDVDA